MAITTGSKISVSLIQGNFNQFQMNVFTYNVLELVGTVNAAQYGEAWWNHVKNNMRALSATGLGALFKSVKVAELGNSTGEYGEFAIPAGEQTGTRSAPTDADAEAPFMSAGVRLTVATRATRPGQKRFGFITQHDSQNGSLGSAYQALLVTLMGTLTTNMTLGAPAAGVVLVPHVVSLNSDGTIRASQTITGYRINPYVTTQNSRKFNVGI